MHDETLNVPATINALLLRNCGLTQVSLAHETYTLLVYLDVSCNGLTAVDYLERVTPFLRILKASYNKITDFLANLPHL